MRLGRPRAHRATTAQLGAVHPLVASTALATPCSYVGRDLAGGSFGFDPFSFYQAGILTNPNVVVAGQIGRGKSSFVKSFLWRQAAFGRQAWVLDPKGEYGALAAAWGARPLRFGSPAGASVNLLEAAPPGAAGSAAAASLVASLLEAAMGRLLRPAERAALQAAVEAGRAGRLATISSVAEALMAPSETDAKSLGTDVAGLAKDGRELALELRRLAAGALGRILDQPTTPGVDLSGPVLVMDLSALHGSELLGLVMGALLAWLGARASRDGSAKRYVVLDEAWAVLDDPGVARWAQVNWKLARAWGVSNIAVVHRASDLSCGPAPGAVTRAEGLLADSETRVVFAQPQAEAEASRAVLGLRRAEAALLPSLGRGVALWKIGSRSFLVRHRLGGVEGEMVDTDAAMAGP